MPSGIAGNEDDLSADSVNTTSSTPGLGKDDKKQGFWSNFKKKTNPIRQIHTLRDRKRKTKAGSETPSPIHQCYSEDSDGGGRRDSDDWNREDCFSDTDAVAMKNGSLKKRHRTRKSNKSLSFEGDNNNKQTLDVPRKSSNIEQYKHSVSMLRLILCLSEFESYILLWFREYFSWCLGRAALQYFKLMSVRLVINFLVQGYWWAPRVTTIWEEYYKQESKLALSISLCLSWSILPSCEIFGLRHFASVKCCPYTMLMDHGPGPLHIVLTK